MIDNFKPLLDAEKLSAPGSAMDGIMHVLKGKEGPFDQKDHAGASSIPEALAKLFDGGKTEESPQQKHPGGIVDQTPPKLPPGTIEENPAKEAPPWSKDL